MTLAGYGWLSDTGAAAAMLALVLGIAVAVPRVRPHMPVYGLTVVWALAGVIVANLSDNPTVAILSGAGIAVLLATLAWTRRA